MSYQDVNWSYNNDAPVTEAPLPLSTLNSYLAGRGYQMKWKDPINPEPIIQWEKKGANPITLAAPQFRADGFYDQLVYDRNDIIDLLLHLEGGGFADGQELLAKLKPPNS